MRRGHDYKTVVCDIDTGELLEIVDSHKQVAIIEKLSEQALEMRESVEEVSIDMWAGFAKVVEEVFPKATIVYDRFHVMAKVVKEVKKIARQHGVNKRKEQRILLRNGIDLNEEEKEKLSSYLKLGNRLQLAYEYKEEFREIYEQSKTVEEGREKLKLWLAKVSKIYGKVVETIRDHFEGICNYFKSRATSGVMEGINNRIKLIKRQGYGFTNFQNFRRRLLACCGK
jgi:transposase